MQASWILFYSTMTFVSRYQSHIIHAMHDLFHTIFISGSKKRKGLPLSFGILFTQFFLSSKYSKSPNTCSPITHQNIQPHKKYCLNFCQSKGTQIPNLCSDTRRGASYKMVSAVLYLLQHCTINNEGEREIRLNEQKISPSSVFFAVLYLYFNGAAEVIAASLSSSVLRFWNSFDYFLPMENPSTLFSSYIN